MKYKDYYAILGIERAADADTVKKAYRKLARKYHPDVSKDPKGEEKFKDVAEAYQTLKDTEKRAAYDRLGSHQSGEDFRPSPDWGREFNTQFNNGEASFEGVDLADLFAQFSRGHAGGGAHVNRPQHGENFDVITEISLEDAFNGTQVTLNLSVPVYDEHGRMRREPRHFEAKIPKGAGEGQRLRLRGQGGKGLHGGRDGDLYLTIKLKPHPLYRVDGHNLFIDLPLTPWEAALGATVEVPTLAGAVNLKVAPATNSGQPLRLSKRGLPKSAGGEGDLYAMVKIMLPPELSEREKTLFREMADASAFNPRTHFIEGNAHAS